MALGDIGAALIDNLLVLAASNLVFGDIAHVTGDFFAVVHHESTTGVVTLVTFSVDDSGNIPAAVQDTEVVSTTSDTGSLIPSIIKVADGIVAVFYDDDAAGVGPIVRTYSVDSSGNIAAGEVDSLDLSTGTASNVMTIKPTEHPGLFVGLFYDAAVDLVIKTFTIDSSGNFSAILDDETINTNPFAVNRPQLIWTGQGDFYAVYYSDLVSFDGILQTHTISSVGIIGAVTDTLTFETGAALGGSLETNGAGRLTILYRSATLIVRTVTVDSSGNMTNGPFLTSFVSAAVVTDLIRIDESARNVFLGVGRENIRSWSIDGAGNPSELDLLSGVNQVFESGNVVRKPGNTSFVVLCGHDANGAADDFYVMSLSVDQVAAAGATSSLPGVIQRELLLL